NHFSNMGKLFNLVLIVLTLCIEIAPFCSCQNSSFISCIEGERQTLLTLKQSFEDPFHRLSSWKGKNCCTWKGVSCDENNGHVVKLNLRATSRFSGETVLGKFSEESSLVAREVNSCLLELRYLEHLDLSGNDFQCSAIPHFFSLMRQLRYLNISNARFNGSVPNNLGNLTGLRVLDVSHDQEPWALRVDDVQWISNLSSLRHLGMAGIYLGEAPDFSPVLNMLPSLLSLHLSLCGLNNSHLSRHPINSTFHRIRHLDLGNNHFTCPVPIMLQNMTSLRILDLSLNLFSCSIQSSFDNLKSLVHLNLAGNDFSSIENGLISILGNMCYLKSLDLSFNQFQGEKIGKYRNLSGCAGHDLETLDLGSVLELSKNSLSGNIPNCWRDHHVIEVLDLSSNKLSGVIPSSIGHLDSLRWLDLSNNNLNGELPLDLKSCTSLRLLDVGGNALSGNVPKWIGESFRFLTILRLRENKLNGSIPSQLCQLSADLHILDLAENNIKGRIPHCFGNFTGMVLHGEGDIIPLEPSKYLMYWEDEHLTEVMKGRFLEYTSTLSLLVYLDLSRNKLKGQIPQELTFLTGLIGLNLSHNQLSGTIPKKIGELGMLESLDLSVNELSGVIPSSMSTLTKLSHLNVSYNNFSGQIPNGNQLQTLDDPSIYAGNPLLCGPPLLKKCLDDEPHQGNNDNGRDNPAEKMWFFIVIMSGFATGFWGVVGVLIFKKSWRHAYFLLVDRSKDWVLVYVTLKIASVKTMIKGNRTDE
ncbi:hypothetical protein SCA6_004590, partial [Theobroma cacao]